MGRGCTFQGCPGCTWRCKCDERCFKCQTGHRMSCMEGSWTDWSYDGPREKFLCFGCKHVWKSPWTKQQFEEMTKDQKSRIHAGKSPSCNRCGNPGQKVGSTFVHCKSSKGWKELEEKVKLKQIDLVNEFTYCPMNNRVSWEDVYPSTKVKWNDTRKGNTAEAAKVQPAIPRPYYERKRAPLNAMGLAFLPRLQ